MSASMIYRTATVLLVLFALNHTLGFNRVDPAWGVSAPINALQTTRFTVQGTPEPDVLGFLPWLRLFLFGAVAPRGGDRVAALAAAARSTRDMQFIAWAFAIVFLATTAVTWIFFFTAPKVFSALITVALFAGA